jgi:RimJ/RimL family protein N-acetyltransferase
VLEPRRPVAGDLGHYEALFLDPVVAKVLLDPPPQLILDEDLEHWERDGWGAWAWFEDGAFVGRGGLLRTGVGGAPSVEVLYAIVTPAAGRGLATEIAQRSVAHAWELGLPEVVGFAWTENPASIRVLEKAGLVYERHIEHAGLPHWFGRAQRPV